MTPMVFVFLLRSVRAKKLCLYFNSLAAAQMRSLVRAGMALAAGDSLRTAETVPGDSPMCAATVFSVTFSGAFMGLNFFSAIRSNFRERSILLQDASNELSIEINYEFSQKGDVRSSSFGRLYRQLK